MQQLLESPMSDLCVRYVYALKVLPPARAVFSTASILWIKTSESMFTSVGVNEGTGA